MNKEYIKWNKEIPQVLNEIVEKLTVEFSKIEAERAERKNLLVQIEEANRENHFLREKLQEALDNLNLAVEANKALGSKNISLHNILTNVKNALKDA